MRILPIRLAATVFAVASILSAAQPALAEVPLPPRKPPPTDIFEVEPPPADGPLVPLPPVRRIIRPATAPSIEVPLRKSSQSRTAATGGEQIVCADPRIVGRRKPPVLGHIAGCMISDPVEVIRIAGIRMSRPATLDCRTARTFANWLTGVVDPLARAELNSKLARVWIMGSYACRTRNNRPGARLSEHSAGRAVDVGGFTLVNGQRVKVLNHWGKGKHGNVLRGAWQKACGSFTTVLGPGADRYHRDHLHLDTANRQNSYCR